MTRTTLADTVAGLAAGITDACLVQEADGPVRIREFSVGMPIEVALRTTADGAVLLVNPPRWRWPTSFDERPGRLSARWSMTRDGGDAT